VDELRAVVATAAHRARVVETVVAAFRDDPAFRFFFADPERFDAQAALFAGHLFDRRVDGGTVWVVDGGSAVAMWAGPPGEPADALAAHGMPADVLDRLDEYDKAVHDLLPPVPHWYLGVLATHPDHAGRRWGRLAMTDGVRLAAEQGFPALLETTNPRNVGIYERAGWSTVGEARAGDLRIWVMRAGR
jgi:ribosomal protein S18 acetylase RimI-like enzyme